LYGVCAHTCTAVHLWQHVILCCAKSVQTVIVLVCVLRATVDWRSANCSVKGRLEWYWRRKPSDLAIRLAQQLLLLRCSKVQHDVYFWTKTWSRWLESITIATSWHYCILYGRHRIFLRITFMERGSDQIFFVPFLLLILFFCYFSLTRCGRLSWLLVTQLLTMPVMHCVCLSKYICCGFWTNFTKFSVYVHNWWSYLDVIS